MNQSDLTRRPRLSWRTLGFREVVVFTAPLVALLLYLVAASAMDYYRAIQFDDYWANSTTVEHRFHARMTQLFQLPRGMSIQKHLTPESSDAGVIDLRVDPAALDAMYDDPQLGWGQWTEGVIEQNGKLLDVSVRKRGDNSIHWLTDKHTITVRTPRTDFFKRYRSFGLSTKTPLTSFVANRLAGEFGLLSSSTTVVPVFLNNRYSGMFRFLEPIDESFLRPFNRMPGNIFRGDAAERGDYFKGVLRDVYANPYIWNRVANNDRPTAAGTGQLRLLIEELNSGDFEAHQRMMRRMDRDELSRLFAFMLLVGDPWHMDATHNNFLYEDPSTSLLHPIPWDIRLLRLSNPPNQRVNALFRAILRDPLVIDGILANIASELSEGTVRRTADSLARSMWTRYHDGFVYDSLRLGMVSEVGYPSEVHQILAANAATLTGWVKDAGVDFVAGTAVGGTSVVDLQVHGFAGADLVALKAGGAPAAVRLDQNDNGVLDAADSEVPGHWDQDSSRFVPARPVALLTGWRTDLPGIRPGVQHYRLFVTGAGGNLVPVLKNRYTGEAVSPTAWDRGSPVPPAMSFSPWLFPEEHGRLHRLRGNVRLTEDLRVGRLDTLIIDPGTRILLDPDVSIVSRGRVIAAGTADRPIVMTRADTVRPWGAFALLGHGADSSLFRYVTWEWGGGDLVDRVEFIGMVNLHRVSGVVVEHSIFRDNLRSDDTFHALHSDFILRRSQFNRANSDAADLDVATGIIEDNLFEDTGGDAIDLMASTPLVRRNRIYRSRDKGISVGENSSPVLFANYIEGCRRGIEIKDRSDPVALNNTLVKNGVGIYSDRKNWRYGGGGFAMFVNNTLRDNRSPLELDVFSRMTLANMSGLDSTAWNVGHHEADIGMDDLAGLYRYYGIEWPGPITQEVGATREVVPVPPLVSVRFEEDFNSIDDGWRHAGGVGSVLKENRTLHASAETRPGMIGQAVDWDLRQSGPATFMMEVSATDMDSVRVTLVSPEGNVTAPVSVSGSAAIFRLVAVRLPARRYSAILISMAPRPRIEKVVQSGWTELKPGQFWLRGYDVYPVAPGVTTVREAGF